MESQKPLKRLKEIKLELTYKCPLRCIHCSSDAMASNAPEMSEDIAKRILMHAIEMGVKEVAFSGGEPFLRTDLLELCCICSKAGIRTQVYSSGNIKDVRTAIKFLRKRKVATIIFSIYAADDNLHDSITRVKGSCKKTLEAIDAALDVSLDVQLHFVPLAMNCMELPRIVDLALDRGISKISVLRFVPQGRGRDCISLGLTNTQNVRLREDIIRHRKRLDIRTGSPFNFLLVNDKPKCLSGIDRLTVAPDYRIYPCDAFKKVRAEEIVGTDEFSRLDTWCLSECWEKSPYLRTIRECLGREHGTPCKQCTDMNRCLSGCLAQKYIATKSLSEGPDPMCLHGMLEC